MGGRVLTQSFKEHFKEQRTIKVTVVVSGDENFPLNDVLHSCMFCEQFEYDSLAMCGFWRHSSLKIPLADLQKFCICGSDWRGFHPNAKESSNEGVTGAGCVVIAVHVGACTNRHKLMKKYDTTRVPRNAIK